ncbi:MAG: PPC domain-containing protein [Chitinivibrionales bacterium]
MRFCAFLSIMVALFVLAGCETSPTGPQVYENVSVDDVRGVWIMVQESTRRQTGEGTYDETYDYTQSNSRMIIDIAYSDLTMYIRSGDQVINESFPIPSGDSFENVISDIFSEENVTVKTSLRDGDLLIAMIMSENESGESYDVTLTMTFSSYSGEVPPPHWQLLSQPQDPVDLSASSYLSGNLSPKQADWYSFEAEEGITYTITTTGYVDTYLRLYNPDDEMIASNDDGDADNNAFISWTCNESGTYTFSVRGYNDSEQGPYVIYLGEEASIDLEQPSDPTVLSANSSSSGHLVVGGAVWYEIEAQEGNTYSIYTTSSMDTYLRLYDSSGDMITYNDDGGTNGNAHIDWNCFETGTYYVSVREYGDNSGGEYEISMSEAVWVNLEEPTDPTVLELNSNTTGELPLNGVVWYEIDAEANSAYAIYTEGSTDTYIRLYQAAGNEYELIAEDDDDGVDYNAALTWQCTESGSYYVSVRGVNDNEEGPFSIFLEEPALAEDLEIPSDLITLVVNSSVTGSIAAGGASWYTFDASSGVTYTMTTSGSMDTYLRLYENGETGLVLIEYNDDGGYSTNSEIVWTCSASDTYYLSVREYGDNEPGSFGLSLTSSSAKRVSEGYDTQKEMQKASAHAKLQVETGSVPATSPKTRISLGKIGSLRSEGFFGKHVRQNSLPKTINQSPSLSKMAKKQKAIKLLPNRGIPRKKDTITKKK